MSEGSTRGSNALLRCFSGDPTYLPPCPLNLRLHGVGARWTHPPRVLGWAGLRFRRLRRETCQESSLHSEWLALAFPGASASDRKPGRGVLWWRCLVLAGTDNWQFFSWCPFKTNEVFRSDYEVSISLLTWVCFNIAEPSPEQLVWFLGFPFIQPPKKGGVPSKGACPPPLPPHQKSNPGVSFWIQRPIKAFGLPLRILPSPSPSGEHAHAANRGGADAAGDHSRAPREFHPGVQGIGERATDSLGPPVVPFYVFFGEGSPAKIDYIKKGTLILTSLLEDLEAVCPWGDHPFGWFQREDEREIYLVRGLF